MADIAADQDRLMAALEAEPKPITSERALQIARQTVSGLRATQFEEWWKSNGTLLLEKLNG